MNEWIKTNKGTVVNLYLIRKMWKSQNPIEHIDGIVYESYLADLSCDAKVKRMSYSEYVNMKRQWLASIMNMPEFY